ncbi:MAG: hypothetical protein HDQ97_10130 [Lachnospiraceae bacterium]|nr:hypothetical protein [Lachnospiraceae bacterium]
MPRQVEKKAFLFYASTLDILKELPEERQGKIAMALIEYGLDDYNYFGEFSGTLSILQPLERILFRSVIYEISVQKRRYYNKNLIRGAIKTFQDVIGRSSALDTKIKDTYIDTINVLKEKYQYVIKHDERNIPEELSALLPEEVYTLFHKRYELKTWKDYMREMFEERLENESRNLSDDVKEKILDKLMKDYLEGGTGFERYEELLEQYAEDN